VKNRHKTRKKQKAEHLLFAASVIFRIKIIRLTLRNALVRDISVSWINNLGVWRLIPRRCGDFTFFTKNTHFWHILF